MSRQQKQKGLRIKFTDGDTSYVAGSGDYAYTGQVVWMFQLRDNRWRRKLKNGKWGKWRKLTKTIRRPSKTTK